MSVYIYYNILYYNICYIGAVPCYRRCRQMSIIPENEKVIQLEGDEDDEGWVDTHHGVGKCLLGQHHPNPDVVCLFILPVSILLPMSVLVPVSYFLFFVSIFPLSPPPLPMNRVLPSHLLPWFPSPSVALEQIQEKVMEMTLEGDDKQGADASSATSSGGVHFPLVGGSGAAVEEDDNSDSDAGSVGDIDDFELEMDDPVRTANGLNTVYQKPVMLK